MIVGSAERMVSEPQNLSALPSTVVKAKASFLLLEAFDEFRWQFKGKLKGKVPLVIAAIC